MLLLGLALIALLTLTGCFKARVTVIVNPDGSGTMKVAFGMNEEAKSFLSMETSGQDPMDALVEELTASGDFEDAEIERWVEGEYEWVQVSDAFATLDDLHQQINDSEMFESFSLRQEMGLIKNRFVLDATLAPMTEETGDFGMMDATGMFEMQFAILLPGEVVEHNGTLDSNGTLTWTLSGNQSVSVHAVSETWNLMTIGGAGIVLACGLVVVVGVVIGVLIARSGRRKKAGAERTQA